MAAEDEEVVIEDKAIIMNKEILNLAQARTIHLNLFRVASFSTKRKDKICVH